MFAGLGVVVADPTEFVGVPLGRTATGQDADLIASQARALVDAMGVPTAEIQGLAGTDEEETRILVQPIETCEIEIAAM